MINSAHRGPQPDRRKWILSTGNPNIVWRRGTPVGRTTQPGQRGAAGNGCTTPRNACDSRRHPAVRRHFPSGV